MILPHSSIVTCGHCDDWRYRGEIHLSTVGDQHAHMVAVAAVGPMKQAMVLLTTGLSSYFDSAGLEGLLVLAVQLLALWSPVQSRHNAQPKEDSTTLALAAGSRFMNMSQEDNLVM